MTPEEWPRVKEVFVDAMRRPAGERAHFLDSACSDDPMLRHEVDSLLCSFDSVDSFLESPAIFDATTIFAESSRQLSHGEQIGHYEVIKRIGAGGMGEVYLAKDRQLGRKVALKVLPGSVLADKNGLRRLKWEARTTSALNHPNILTVYEIGDEDGLHFIATEYVEGQSLRQRLERQAIEVHEALEITIQIAAALAAAHENGIVHRDIKPENVMLRQDGLVKVLDFGLAKLADTTLQGKDRAEAFATGPIDTVPGMILGTPGYMSPEQARGRATDARTDIWSLGCVLYETLTGRRPFSCETGSDAMAEILLKEPPPPSQYVSEFPVELERIIGLCLKKRSEERYQNITDLAADMKAFREELDFTARLNRSESADLVELDLDQNRREGTFFSIFTRNGAVSSIALLLAVTFFGFGAWYFLNSSASVLPIDSIAVLPFQNATGSTEADYVSDGITESLINSLTQLPRLRVIARTTAFRYKSKQIEPKAVGRDLQVKAVLTGQVRQVGETLFIQVDLIDASTGAQLWGEEYERSAADILSIKKAIAQDVREQLHLRLTGEEQQLFASRDTTNADAYRLYLKGRFFWNKRTKEGLSKALEYFQQSAAIDPDYALAYVGMADCFTLLEEFTGFPWKETEPKARAALKRALEIDPSLAEAYTTLAFTEQKSWNFSAADRDFRRAIQLNPNYSTAHHWYSIFLRDIVGDSVRSMAEIKEAQQLDPLSSVINLNVAAAYLSRGEFDAAIEEARRVVEMDPGFPHAHNLLGVIYCKQKRFAEAITELQMGVELSNRDGDRLTDLGVCYAVAGMKQKARAILTELEEKFARHEALGHNVAEVYAALGDKDNAFAWLEKDFQSRIGSFPTWRINGGKFLLREALSSDPRWTELFSRIDFDCKGCFTSSS